MPAGTLTLTNNSAAVGGSGTAFTTELAAGDFILVTVGGVPYTLPVKTVNSNTSLTLVSNFTGPTQSGSAWSAIPRVAMNLVTAALVAQSAEALRGLNYDKQNWQQVFSGTGNITVNLPDGSSFTGPAWGGIATSLDAKLDKAQNLNDLNNKTTARTNLGLKGAAVLDVGTSAGTVAAGNDSRLSTVNGMSGGVITGNVAIEATALTLSAADVANSWFFPIIFRSGQGTNVNMAQIYHSNQGVNINTGLNTGTSKFNSFSSNGNYSCQGNITCVALTQTSDRDKKENIENIGDALNKIKQLNGVTYSFIDTGMPSAGVLAQEVLEVLPEAVGSCFDEYDEYTTTDRTEEDGTVTQVTELTHARDESKRTYTVEYSGVIAICVEAIKELESRNSINESEIAELKARLEAVDGLKD